jgi:hypothetical protein
MFWVVLLRIVHVFAAALWFGGAISSTFFVGPAVKATSPDSGKFMQYFLRKRHFHTAMSWFANLTILAGALLLWRDSDGFRSTWLITPTGIGFCIGAFFGILVYLWGSFIVGPTGVKMGKIGEALQNSGGRPDPQLIRDMQATERKFSHATLVDTALIVLALLFMATARYFGMLL